MKLLKLAILAQLLLTATLAQAQKNSAPVERLAPVYRHTILVTDLERSLTLYRDVLGMEVSKINQSGEDSYSAVFFNMPRGSQKRFAYLSGEDGRENILGLAEVPGLELPRNNGIRTAAWVQTVADVEGVMEQVQAMGLELVEPIEFVSRESGTPGLEAGVIDFDGHLIMFYGLKRPEKH
ncbi:MAG: VOC family protein [Pseudomonadota bacterium]